MARYVQSVESAAALAADTVFANLVAASGAGFKLRRVILGCRAGAVVPTSQQVEVALVRATARGTATATSTGIQTDQNSPASAITGLDTTWSVAPTLSSGVMQRFSFNTQGGVDIPFEFMEELACPLGTANGFAFKNIANALPASHLLTLSVEWEE